MPASKEINKCTVDVTVSLMLFMLCFKVNSVNCNTSWKISLFLAYEDNSEEVLKGVGLFSLRMNPY